MKKTDKETKYKWSKFTGKFTKRINVLPMIMVIMAAMEPPLRPALFEMAVADRG